MSAQASHSATLPSITMERRAGGEHPRPHPLVGADPRVDREAVLAGPGGVLGHRVRRVAVLPGGSQRGDHVREAVLDRPAGRSSSTTVASP